MQQFSIPQVTGPLFPQFVPLLAASNAAITARTPAEEARYKALCLDPVLKKRVIAGARSIETLADQFAYAEFDPLEIFTQSRELQDFYLESILGQVPHAYLLDVSTCNEVAPASVLEYDCRLLLQSIDGLATKTIHHSLNIHQVPIKRRETPEIQDYLANKKTLLRLACLKYFSLANRISQEAINQFFQKLQEKITDRTLTLNHQTKLMQLHQLIPIETIAFEPPSPSRNYSP